MSKTFKSTAPDSSLTLEVRRGVELDRIIAEVRRAGVLSEKIAIDPSDAPAVALAILEAAGVVPSHKEEWTVGEPDNLARIAADLQHHIERRAARTKEAADREALEIDARTLFEAGNEYLNDTEPNGRKVKGWDAISDRVREAHVVVAKHARTMYGGTK